MRSIGINPAFQKLRDEINKSIAAESPKRARLLAELQKGEWLTSAELSRRTGMNPSVICTEISTLRRFGHKVDSEPYAKDSKFKQFRIVK